MLWEIAPVDHRYEVAPPGPCRVTDDPEQKVVLPITVMAGVDGLALTLNTAVAVPVQPKLSNTVTVYVAADDTDTACVVAPVDQRYDELELAVNDVLLPLHTLPDEGEILAITVPQPPSLFGNMSDPS